MISEELLHRGISYPSVYFQIDVTLAVTGDEEAEVVANMLLEFSVSHKRDLNNFFITAQKVTLDGESLIAFLALLHDHDVHVSPKVRLEHMGDKRFNIERFGLPN